MTEEQDEGFHISHTGETPIAYKLLLTVQKIIEDLPADATVTEQGVVGQLGYTAGAVAELERRLTHLEDVVRDIMAR